MKKSNLLYLAFVVLLIATSCKEKSNSETSSIAKAFEKALENPETTTSISLKEQGIEEIPNSIDGRFVNLFQIILDDNNIKFLPESIGEINKLKYLHISKNKLETLPKSIGNLNNLEWLYAYSNEITSLPNVAFNFQKNAIVDLKWNKIESIPEEFCNSQFGTLLLTASPLTGLPENFGNLKELKELNIANTNISELPDSFYNLQKLSILDIRGTKLTRKHYEMIKIKLQNCTIRSDFE